jgi:hypothetical protein
MLTEKTSSTQTPTSRISCSQQLEVRSVERGHSSCRKEVRKVTVQAGNKNRGKEGHGSTGREPNYHSEEPQGPSLPQQPHSKESRAESPQQELKRPSHHSKISRPNHHSKSPRAAPPQ